MTLSVPVRKKIHHWCPCSQIGGVEMALLAFMQGASEIEHIVYTADDRGAGAGRWREAGAAVIVVPSWSGFLGLAWLGHWRHLMEECSPQQLIIWSPTRLDLVLSPLSAGTKTLVHFGNVGPMGCRARLMNALGRLWFKPTVRPTLVMCSATVANSLARESSLAASPRVVISNAVQSAYSSKWPRQAHAHGWGMVARLDAIKDHVTLLKAVPLVARRHPEFRLTLVGDGLLRPELEALIRELGIGDKVTLTGTIARPWELMSGWGGAVFSTGPQEGFGIAAAEAMAMGLPCVFTDLPVLREVGGDAVLYARPGSAESLAEQIDGLIADTALAARLGQAAALRARECFSPQAFAAAYLRAFELSA